MGRKWPFNMKKCSTSLIKGTKVKTVIPVFLLSSQQRLKKNISLATCCVCIGLGKLVRSFIVVRTGN